MTEVLFLMILVKAAVGDWKTHTIDDWIPVTIFSLGMVSMCVSSEIGFVERMLGIVSVSVPMFALTVFIPGVFGGGDMKLMAASGWFLGWRANLFGAIIGIFLAGGYCVVRLITGGITRKTEIPLGPFLAAGLATAVFFFSK